MPFIDMGGGRWVDEKGNELMVSQDGRHIVTVVGRFVLMSDGKLYQRDPVTQELIPMQVTHPPVVDL